MLVCLILPVTLTHHLGLGELVDHHVDLGDALGRANAGDKMLTLVASALAGGDCIDDADALRAGRTEQVLGCAVKAPSTLGTFLRSFRWGHVRQLDRVSRELLAHAWAAGAGPGDDPLTIDLDSTVCETYGLGKEGAQRHNCADQRGYHPLLAVAAGTGDVLMARLRQGPSQHGPGRRPLPTRDGGAGTLRWRQRADRRQLVLPVATTIFAGRDGVIIRYGGTVDYRPTNQAIEAETYGRQDTGNGSGQGWDERAFSAQVAEWPIAVAGETGASVAHSARSLRRGVGG